MCFQDVYSYVLAGSLLAPLPLLQLCSHLKQFMKTVDFTWGIILACRERSPCLGAHAAKKQHFDSVATDGLKGNVEKTAALGFVDGQEMMIQPIEINRVISYL